MNPTVAERLADFTSTLNETDLPEAVIAKARTCLLNGLGIAYVGLDTPYHPVAAAAARAMYGNAYDATLLPTGERSSVSGAILTNGALFHGRAQEDTCGAAHLGAVVIPLLIALVESGRAPAGRIIPALVAGYEAGGLFEDLLAGKTTPRGFRATTLFGVTAAAAASSRLLGLSADQTAAALNNAVSLSGGLLQSFVEGTDEWRYQVGTTAQLGWTATELARAGSVSSRAAFEGEKGLASAFAETPLDDKAIGEKLGRDWQTLRVAFKPFPVCAFNQTPVTAALKLRDQVAPDRIRAVAVKMNPYECGYAGMDSTGPFTSISGTLMSIPFCIALTLVRGTPTMRNMTTYDDPEVNALEKRIVLSADPEIPVLSCRIRVTLDDDTLLDLDCPMTPADYAYDFGEMARRLKVLASGEGLDPSAIDRLASFCADPDHVPLAQVFQVFHGG